ncbi:unnamed protein product (mitochondrion) [Plasmodiophora brassicae]|uniref:Uncharacterized protein n=1 Tax=Plasmodiophora brassicae TaxID=37360 RepID=A0A0G4IXP7_PLABS|nr:hypothetical protein PBRA_007565 [Plasmodiophora brassicae]SPR02078.1 unnamed protein product [Plasmodiophora brassicae]
MSSRRRGDVGARLHSAERVRVRLRESHGTGLTKRNVTFTVGRDPTSARQPFRDQCLSLVLPYGYPQSVTPDYATFQVWDTVQGLCSYLRSILCQQSLFAGLGVGDASATASSAALSWMFLHGMSMLGGVLFAFRTSTDFGADPKTWRLFADCVNDVGLTLTMAAPATGRLFLLVACLGSICSAVCGVAAGATKAAITQHFCRQRSNSALVSDIYSKEGIQETIVSITGLVLGSLLSTVLHGSLGLRWAVFIGLTALHVVANYWAVTALCLTTINYQRAYILIRHFMLCRSVLSPAKVARQESVWNFLRFRRRPIRFGAPLHEVVKDRSDLDWLQEELEAERGAELTDPPYIIRMANGAAHVACHESIGSLAMLRSMFQAMRLLSGSSPVGARHETRERFDEFAGALRSKGWVLDEINLPDETWRCEWPPAPSA